MLNRNLLRAEMAKNGITQAELSRKIGMNPATFARKMKKSSFYTEEASKIIELLKIEHPEDIFFAAK